MSSSEYGTYAQTKEKIQNLEIILGENKEGTNDNIPSQTEEEKKQQDVIKFFNHTYDFLYR